MQKFLFFVFLILAFSLLTSTSYQSRSVINPASSEKIDPELRELKSLNSEEKVEVIVWLNNNKSTESLEEIGNVTHKYSIIPAVAMEVPVNELENLAKEPNVEEIVPDRIVSAFRLESMSIIKATNASSTFNVNGTGVNISIIDTGIFNHSEFQSPNRIIKQKCYCNVAPGNCCPDATAESDNATDDEGHGTHVAGIAAGIGDGYTHGVATNASLFAVKVLNSSGTGRDSDIVAGIDWAVNNSTNVISLSLGGSISAGLNCYSYSSSKAVDNATKRGVVVIVAAGNSGPPSGTIEAPGCAKRAITIGYTGDDDIIISSSSRGPTGDNRTKPDLTAPGNSINSTTNSIGGYATLSGTSQAAPHVTGVAALVIAKFNQINGYYPNPDRVKAILITAVNTTGQRNNSYGSGRIDAYEALRIINFTKNNTISAGEEHHYKINVTSNDFKTTLYWPEDVDTSNNLNLFVGNGTYNYSYSTDANDTVEQVFFTDARLDFWDVYVVSNASNNQSYYLAANMEIFNDTTAPALILEKPENITYTNRTGIPINFTTDINNHTIWYKLDSGDEIKITANTTFNVNSDGSHYITLYVNDSYDNTNQSTKFFTVDTIPPSYSNNSTNSTIAGQFVEFRLKWTDNLGLSGYIFSLDNGSTSFTNYTWADMIGTGNWSNVSNIVNSTIGTTIRWIVYANDTINNWNKSETYTFYTTVDNKPTWSNNVTYPSSPTYSSGQNYQFNITWSDDVSLSTAIIEHNFTGSSTPHNTSFSGNESGVFYFNVSDLAAKIYVWKSYANDSSNNFNSTNQFIYIVSKSSSDISLYLNGTRNDKTYVQNKTANITVALDVLNKNVNLTSNVSGWVLQTGLSPQINYTNLTTLGVFNFTGYWLGDENHTADSESWLASVVTTTVSTTTSTSDGNGEDTGGGTSPSTIKKISRIFTQLIPGNRTEWAINQVNICITKIEIEVKNTLNNVKITIAKLDGRPSIVSVNVSGKLYQYLEINKTVITDSDIKNLKFNFIVNRSWVTSNNINKATIALSRYYNDRWYSLPTNSSGENSSYLYFVAESPGFSIFAVTGEAPITTTIVETTTVTTAGTTTIISGGQGSRTEEKVGGWSYWYLIIVIIPITIVAAFFGLRMSSKNNEEAYEKLKMKWAFERLKRKWSNRRS
jgi:serine protease AprX